RGERLSYFIDNRYIADLHSNITTFSMGYEVSPKYTLSFAQAFDFSHGQNVSSSASLLRRFDAFFVVFRASRNDTTGETGFGFNVFPNGLGAGLDPDRLANVLDRRR